MLKTNVRQPEPGERRVTKGDHVIRWIETHCVGTVGAWAQRPARLMGWQKTFIRHLFTIDPTTGRRLYRWALVGVPKKNGKTELAAWLALYFLIADGEPSPLVACAASSDYQADLVFGAAKRCAEWSPTLSKICVTFDREIIVPSIPGAKLVRVAAVSGANDGPSWHVVICDEFHEWTGKKGRDVHTVLTNGVGARQQPLILQITTAGYDVEGTVCGEHYTLGEALAEDPAIDPYYLFMWWEGEETADYRDPATWRDANPSWGMTLPDPEKYLKDQINKKTEAEFRRYFLNQWTLAEDVWLPAGAWDACEDPRFRMDPELPLFVGIDGALKRDSFAIVASQRQGEIFAVEAWIWENPFPVGHDRRHTWKLDLDEPLNKLKELFEAFPVPAMYDDEFGALPGPAFGYDPRFLEYPAQRLTGFGLNMLEVPQTDQRMCPAAELLYELILNQRLSHEGSAKFSRHIHSAIPKQKERGWRLARPTGSKKHIDAAIALVIAANVAFVAPAEEDVDGFEIY